jgi:hypothetical protein
VTALTPQLQPVAGSTIPPAGVGQTATTQTFFYRGTATVTLPDRGLPVTFKASQIYEQQYQNPWDWALFFVDPLEIEPGPQFTIDGWVQTNSALYTPLSTLTFDSKVTYGTNWYINAMAGDNHLIAGGDTYAPPNWPSNEPPIQGTPGQPFGLNPASIFNTTDPNNNNDGYHELIQIPNPAYPDPLAQQRYFDQAGAKVIVSSNAAGTITATIYDNSTAATTTSLGTTIGTVTYNPSATTPTTLVVTGTGLQRNIANAIESALTLNQSLQDNREGTTVAITQLNVGTIAAAITASPGSFTGFNQVIYIDDSSAGTGNERAIELTNGAVLPDKGLTIASGNPVYIQGDYNTGINPPSDSGNTAQPTGSNPTTGLNYVRQPSSVVADAVDILSNNWTNSGSTNSLSGRVADNTTINTAIMAGNVPTANGNYSGGAENFPRFLENWSGSTLTYYGSMVELYASQQATGIWGKGNVYNPPVRAWYYDNNFQLKPPPGSIMVISYLKGQWYQQ